MAHVPSYINTFINVIHPKGKVPIRELTECQVVVTTIVVREGSSEMENKNGQTTMTHLYHD